jgi:hypothetical protein
MIKILDSEFFGCDFTLDSKISEISDVYEFISFILKCEEYYNLVIFDDEAMFIETNNLSFKDIEDFFIFLRDGYATGSIHNLIIKHIEELSLIRPDYRWYIANRRNDKIDSLFNSI